jgi:hypothetical protein
MACMFMCGSIKDRTPDPLTAGTTILWESGVSLADQFCGRVFVSKYSHLFPGRSGRQDLKKAMAADKNKQDEFMAYRNHLIEKKRTGKRGFTPRKVGSPKKHLLRKKQRYSEELRAPPPSLVPYDEYMASHTAADLKRNGHRVKKLQGMRFVVVPPEKGTPWVLQQTFANDIEKEEEVEKGEDSGVDSDADQVYRGGP